jgi:NAD(P)-dependent dehydrogenase (short-subunit alcohol dehydrogenase family)
MKIAITGHSAGIGQALSKVYETRGHEIIGLSRRNGNNIRSLPKILNPIRDCDMLINNAQSGFGQTELLFAVWEMWKDEAHKKIINISTIMTSQPVSSILGLEYDAYRVQKISLEEATRQLNFKKNGPKIITVKPGAVATQPNQSEPNYSNVDEWAEALVNCLESVGPKLIISEISLGVNYGWQNVSNQ